MKLSPHTFAGADDADLVFAQRELAVGREQLRQAHVIVGSRERAEATKDALARLSLASRAIADVVQRRTPRMRKASR